MDPQPARPPPGVRRDRRTWRRVRWRDWVAPVLAGVGVAAGVAGLAGHVGLGLLALAAGGPGVAVGLACWWTLVAARERAQVGWLLAIGELLARPASTEELAAGFAPLVCRAFRARRATVVLLGENAADPLAVRARGPVVERGPATPGERALLAVHAAHRGLLAPLEADGVRVGTVVCEGGSSTRDRALLAPLATAFAAALVGAEHRARLAEEADKLQAVVDLSSDGIAVTDAAGRVLVWNPALVALTGISATAALRRPVHAVLEPLDAAGRPWTTGPTLSPAAPRWTGEFGLRRPDGDLRWVRATRSGIFDRGRLVRVVIALTDVTRQARLDRLKSDFIATVSHELRTPLTPISGYTDLLRRHGDELAPERRRAYLDLIADRVAHLGRLVEDLLLAAGVSEPSATLHLAPGDLAALAERACAQVTDPAAGSRLRLIRPDGPVPVTCDARRVVQVVGNLLSNALKFSPADAEVSVLVERQGDRARLVVSDEGCGIPADQCELVFEKFHRVEDPLRMTTSGSGLGLYVARQLARGMGGELSLRSTLGAGSQFCFELPVAGISTSRPPSGLPIARVAPEGRPRPAAGPDPQEAPWPRPTTAIA